MAKEIKFEDAVKRLEKIVDDLEGESISLDDSLKKYEEGIKLVQFCSKKLNDAQKKVEVLVKTGKGKFKTEFFEEE